MRQKTLGEAAAEPEPILRERRFLPACFQNIKGRELQIADPPGERLTRLFKQVQRGRTQKQVKAVTLSGAAGAIDQTTQHGKQTGGAVDFVEDDQPPQVVVQKSSDMPKYLARRSAVLGVIPRRLLTISLIR